MGSLIDLEEDSLSTDENESQLQVEEPQVQEEHKPEVEEIPEKYRGKSVAEIAKMHQEAEKLIGRQGSEVGELRKIVDDFIKSQTTKKEEVQEEVDETTYFTDPQKAVQRQIESHPALKQAQEAAAAMKKAEVMNKIQTAHPDYMDIAQDPAFAEWVQKSRVRMELFNRADQQFDFDSADELLSTWKERKELSKKMTEVSAADRKQQLKAATTTMGSGSDESVGKKIYRRSDIIKLMQTNPDKYDAMQNEIMAAYREGRVK